MRLAISVAEPSGDRLAAELLAALARTGPVHAAGVAGPRLRAAGVRPVARMEDLGVMGLVEVLGHLGVVRRTRRALTAAVAEGVDALIVVDAPDLHLPVARAARGLGVPVIGYVSPQVWAWRPGRVRAIAEALDALLCLFAFEPALYTEPAEVHGCDVRWVGHPVVDRVPVRGAVDPLHLGLLPGSRQQELDRHLGVYVATAERTRAAHPGLRATVVLPPHLSGGAALPSWMAVAHDVSALSDARWALTKSGTVTLELACMGVPMVVAHRVSPLTFAVGRRLVTGVKHLALPNVLSGREVVPEVLQALDPDALADRLRALPEVQPWERSAVGLPGAADRAAAAVRELVGAQQP